MLSWILWSLAAVFGLSVLAWNQRLRRHRLDELGQLDPDLAARLEQRHLGGGAQSVRISGFDKGDQF